MDDLAQIGADDPAAAFMREQRKRATAIAGDIAAYHAALGDVGISDDLRDVLTRDFGGKWHTFQLGTETELDVTALYAEGDE